MDIFGGLGGFGIFLAMLQYQHIVCPNKFGFGVSSIPKGTAVSVGFEDAFKFLQGGVNIEPVKGLGDSDQICTVCSQAGMSCLTRLVRSSFLPVGNFEHGQVGVDADNFKTLVGK